MQHLNTPHGIAGLPELADLPAQDVALDTFRLFFPLPSTSARVAEDGRTMLYRLRETSQMENYLKIARLVITGKDLPLEASQDLFKFSGIVFENNLVITYTGQ